MGEVYRARDTRLERVVAIKLLPPHLAGDRSFRERFGPRGRAVSQLAHANLYALRRRRSAVCRSHTPARTSCPWIIEGETLAVRVARGRLSTVEALRIAADIASALDHAHRHGIVHRDLTRERMRRRAE